MIKELHIIDDISLMDEWDYEANLALDPKKLTRGSNKKASWKCSKCGHKWKVAIYHRATRKTGCPKCRSAQRKKLIHKESLAFTNPETAKYWHPTKNKNLSPSMFKAGSRFKAWWRCNICRTEWETPIQNHIGCSYCKKQSNLLRNSIKKHNPKLVEEWHPTKNNNLTPNDVLYSSNAKAWWVCPTCKYEWEAKISNRAVLGRGCPACVNKVVVVGVNDLGTTHPHIASEWHPTKNGDLTPQKVTYGKGQKVWWLCPIGHKYQATILHRSHGTLCPNCHTGRQTSFAEEATFYYVRKLYPDAISRYKAKFLGRMELDIYIPSIKYAIEYDGEAWHKKETIKREQLKYKRCHENGIKLIRLREKFPELGSDIADYQFGTEELYKPKNLEHIIQDILRHINFSNTWLVRCPIDVNIDRDRYKILKYRVALKKDSLLDKFPQIAKEWHPTKNGNLTPDMFKPKSGHKTWWKCSSCGCDYESTIGHRTYGTGCPKCAIEKVTEVKRKPVNMIDPNTGKVISTFISISDASRKMKINNSNISMACKGQRSKAGGYCWSYAKKLNDTTP